MNSKLAALIPDDAQYSTQDDLAVVAVEVGGHWLHVTARLTVTEEDDHLALAAEYVWHEWTGEGEVDQKWIDYGLRVIETNDFGVQA